ncbi:MAG: kinase [Tissierellia bacterium]|nr:kinase [Tissierellia bacterium]
MINSRNYITVIGGANVDIIGSPYKNLRMKDSNPGKTTISLGGVGRNIGENLVRLGIETQLITAIGKDIYGKLIIEESEKIGLNIGESLILKNENTSTYLAILDKNGDMELAISSMGIIEKMDIAFIESKREIIENSAFCIVDTNIPFEVLEYLVRNFNVDFFLDTVSTTKAMKVKNILSYFHTIKPNKLEAEILSGIKIRNMVDLKKAANYFVNKGINRVFITLGEDGVYYLDGEIEKYIDAPDIEVVNATGAGDAFMAALAYSYINNLDIENTIKFAIATSIFTLKNEYTINPNLSVENINNRMKELGLC